MTAASTNSQITARRAIIREPRTGATRSRSCTRPAPRGAGWRAASDPAGSTSRTCCARRAGRRSCLPRRRRELPRRRRGRPSRSPRASLFRP
ncbi:hypothetical protein Henu3_gp36 [Mycobacterium phage Henu3]|uniref:Uncharacterized protein n=1 Tax=Mycobacterium phage Henu3 TaxID=2492961 RepID=A0A410T7V4_9CAUD|nr:hypothetical protein I5G68_gp33 [Mycobacterium phage Henu3]QAU04980.1 hypothetical protein Henu3_gp36 [Mycobacterium phage Henu3]